MTKQQQIEVMHFLSVFLCTIGFWSDHVFYCWLQATWLVSLMSFCLYIDATLLLASP